MKRTSRFYDGSELTTKKLKEVLPTILNQINSRFSERSDLILAAWPEIIGANLAMMTQAISFSQGILVVKVKNSTLYSLLQQNDKVRLTQALRVKFPKIEIKTILFQIG